MNALCIMGDKIKKKFKPGKVKTGKVKCNKPSSCDTNIAKTMGKDI